jgi:hypothetical protein
LPAFQRGLRDLHFEFYEKVGSPDRDVFDQLAEAFQFPEYYGGGWDAFNDSICGVEPPPRSALLWHDADLFAAAEAKLFGECCAIVSGVFDSWSAAGKQAHLVLVGNGPGFSRP